MKSIGFIAVVSSATIFFIEALSGFIFSIGIAKTVCGDRYLKEVNGVLTDQACGFNADMYLVAMCVLGVATGLLLLLLVYFRTTRRRQST